MVENKIPFNLTCNRDNGTHSLATLNNDKLLLWRGSGEHNLAVVHQYVVQLVVRQVFQLPTMHYSRVSLPEKKIGYKKIFSFSLISLINKNLNIDFILLI